MLTSVGLCSTKRGSLNAPADEDLSVQRVEAVKRHAGWVDVKTVQRQVQGARYRRPKYARERALEPQSVVVLAKCMAER